MSEEFLRGIGHRTVLEAFADGIVAADANQRIVYVNGAAARLLGWPSEELPGKPLLCSMAERVHAAYDSGYGATSPRASLI